MSALARPCTGCRQVQVSGVSAAQVGSVLLTLAVLAAGGTAGALLLAKHKVLGGLLGSVAALLGLSWWDKAHASPLGPPTILTVCPDGTPAPGGSITACPPPKMGNNDPDAPPGGWSYNAPVQSSSAVQAAAAALAAANPCDPSSEQLVRNFQGAAGLAQLNSGAPDWNLVTPPGTDGRYGGDTAKALAQYVSTAPAPCYSNSNPTRPMWWGPVGTMRNSSLGAAAAVAAATS